MLLTINKPDLPLKAVLPFVGQKHQGNANDIAERFFRLSPESYWATVVHATVHYPLNGKPQK
jgi:hypothetical protein